MADSPTKSQIDRLGERLKKSKFSEADLHLLDDYRRSFQSAYHAVVEAIVEKLGLRPTGRPAKSTTSISEKLRRESIRLTQVQDIAGCRLIVEDIVAQDRVVEQLCGIFPSSTVVDRREKPSHGYRAVHVIVHVDDRPIEIQVRTALQHKWAELSEKFADLRDPAIKYGGGHADVGLLLSELSEGVQQFELLEKKELLALALEEIVPDDRLATIRERIRSGRSAFTELIEETIARLRGSR